MTNSPPLIAFISGPLDVDSIYFDTHYRPRIDHALASNHSFIIGPVSGIDTLALNYLVSRYETSRISIYMTSWEAPCHRRRLEDLAVKQVILSEDVVTTQARDAAMTRDSDYDILRFRTEEECREVFGKSWRGVVSNTEMNWRRRRLGREDKGMTYVRHVSVAESEDQGVKWTWKACFGKENGVEGGVETCDGSCDGHRRGWK